MIMAKVAHQRVSFRCSPAGVITAAVFGRMERLNVGGGMITDRVVRQADYFRSWRRVHFIAVRSEMMVPPCAGVGTGLARVVRQRAPLRRCQPVRFTLAG